MRGSRDLPAKESHAGSSSGVGALHLQVSVRRFIEHVNVRMARYPKRMPGQQALGRFIMASLLRELQEIFIIYLIEFMQVLNL